MATLRRLLQITFVVLDAREPHILVQKTQHSLYFLTVKVKRHLSLNFPFGKASIFGASGCLINSCVDFDIFDLLKPFDGPYVTAKQLFTRS